MNNKKQYTHIFFDLDNTLWDFEKNSFFAMQNTCNYFNLNFDGNQFENFFEVYSKHNHFLWSEYRNKNIGKKELTKKRFQKTLEELNIEGINPELMNKIYLEEMPKQKHLNKGSIEILNYLKGKRYKLYIITNGFREVQFKKLKSSGLKTYFQKCFISEDVKTPKPGKEIFEYAIKSSNARKSKSLMIGDDWDVDVLGALNFGIDAVYYNPKGTENSISRKYEKEKIVYCVNELLKIKDFL